MIIVFLGPSLSYKEARSILPQAYFLPPVKCGDILRVMRLKPQIILIIDGYFEQQASVWHKEILFALENNIAVLGAASMGALRAAELTDFGMLGVGKIFHAYYTKEIKDDDEVAVLHDTEENHYRTLTEAMVNIRATIKVALKQNIIHRETGDSVINCAKNLFYQNRQWQKVLLCAQKEGVNEQQVDQLSRWLQQGGHVNQKALDAIELLSFCKNLEKAGHLINTNTQVNHSVYFRALQMIVCCQPFHTFKKWLPRCEKVALTARLFGQHYVLAQRIAYMMAIICSYPKNSEYTVTQAFWLGNNVFDRHWQSDNDCTGEELEGFLDKLKWISHFTCLTTSETEIQSYLLSLLKLSGDYFKYKKKLSETDLSSGDKEKRVLQLFREQDKSKFQLQSLIAVLWQSIDTKARAAALVPNDQEIHHYTQQFCYKNNISTYKELVSWLEHNDVTAQQFNDLMAMAVRFDYIVLCHNIDALGIMLSKATYWWFLDALRLTGLYTKAKQIVVDPIERENFLAVQKLNSLINDDYAYYHDFEHGEPEIKRFIQALQQDDELMENI